MLLFFFSSPRCRHYQVKEGSACVRRLPITQVFPGRLGRVIFCYGAGSFFFSWGQVLIQVWIKCTSFVIENVGITIAIIH